MRGMTNIVIGDTSDVDAICASLMPVEEWRGIAVRGITPAKIAMLHSILTGDTFDEVFDEYDHVYAVSEDGPWVIRVPDAPLEKLAELEEDVLAQVGAEWAASEECESEGWPVEEVQALLEELAELARAAVDQDQAMFLWMGE